MTVVPPGAPATTPAVALSPPPCDDAPLWDLWLSRLHMPAVTVADEVGIFSRLDRYPARGADIAEATGITVRAADALLGLLAALGLLRRLDGRYHLTEPARHYLLPTSPYYWGGVLDAFHAQPQRHSPEALLQAILVDPAPPGRRVTDDWKAAGLDDERARLITAYMHAHSFPSAVGLAQRVRLDNADRLLDVGSGSGCFSVAYAVSHPALACTMLDLPPVLAAASELVDRYRLTHRVSLHAADFFAGNWPKGHDVVLLSNILHDWGLDRCHYLLDQAYRALPVGGSLIVHEMLLGDDGTDLAASALALQMAAGTEGTQFTTQQMSRLLVSTGFTDVAYTHTFGHFWAATANKSGSLGP